MLRVIKITDAEVYIGNSQGKVIKLDKSIIGWTPEINDEVELFKTNDGEIIVAKAVPGQQTNPTTALLDDVNKQPEKNLNKNSKSQDKYWIGILCSFFLGLIGLIIGVCLYDSTTYERTSFMDGWIKGFIVSLITGVVLFIFSFMIFQAQLSTLLNSLMF